MDEELKQHITAKDTWLRGLFILLFGFLLAVARVVTWAVVVLQFLFTLFTGRPNPNLLSFGASLAHYIYQCFTFVTFNSDVRPFPFQDWPDAELLSPASAVNATEESAAPAKKQSTPKKASRKKTAVKKTTSRRSTDTGASSSESPAASAEDTSPEAKPTSE